MMSAGKPLVYVVDDDEAVLKALCRLITSLGYCVQTFTSAQDFLDSVPADAEGFLIVDVFMPQIDGFKLYEKLLAMESKLKVIMITAHPQESDQKRSRELGILAFLEKPIDDQDLIDLLKS